MSRALQRGVYLVTPDWQDTARLLQQTQAALQGGAVCVQYRNKLADDALRLAQAHALRALTRRFAVPFIVNDALELADAVAADGVHWGRDDSDFASLAALRIARGKDFLIGVSCYDDWPRALAAQAAGASYVAFGAMFASSTKPHAVAAPVSLVQRARAELDCSVVCIGGIRADNAASLVTAGADCVAVITDIYQARDAEVQTMRFAELYR